MSHHDKLQGYLRTYLINNTVNNLNTVLTEMKSQISRTSAPLGRHELYTQITRDNIGSVPIGAIRKKNASNGKKY